MYDVEDEESMDDPISLIYEGFPEDGVQKSSRIYEVEDDVEDDPISLILNPNEKYIDTDVVDLRSSDEENEEQNPIPKSGYGTKNFVIPVTFLDFYRNVKLLKKCKPLSIKVVDCDKHPWYYGNRIARKPTVNVNCLTLGKHSNLIMIKQEIKEEKSDEDAVTLENEEVKTEKLATPSQSLNNKAQEETQIKSVVNTATAMPTLNHNSLKLENESENAKKSNDLSQVDFKRNSGLVGLTISKKDLDSNLEKVTKKKTPKKRKDENIVNDMVMQGIGVTLNNLGTSVTPLPEKKDDNVLDDMTKDSHPYITPHVTLHQLSSNSNINMDKIHNNAISPTRCSLKITSSKILEKIIQLKKAKSQDALKPKPPQKPKKILDKDHAVSKLNLKRRSPTKNVELYINSSKESHSNSLSVKPQKPQKDQNTVKNKIHKKKSVETSPIIPIVTLSLRNQEIFTPNTSKYAEKLDQTQIRAALPTPKSHSKKLKLQKSVLNNDPNKIVQNKPITSMYLNTPDKCQMPMPLANAANASNSSLTSGLNEVVVSNVQSLRNMTTLNSNRPTQEKTEIDLSRPEHFNFKGTKNIDTVAAKSNFNITKNNENVIQNGDTTTCGTKVKKTCVLESPSISYMQAYNANALNIYNSLKELSRKTSRTTQPDKNKFDGEILKETKKTTNTTKKNHINLPKDTVIVTNNNRNVTSYDVSNQDTVTSNSNINNAAMSPKTVLNVQRTNAQIQLDEYLYMKQNQFNSQPNPTHTVNNFLASNTQVYNLPGNNTVIMRKPPAHMQTDANRSTGLPIQTVVNHRPSTGPVSPWSLPPPNTNVACNIPYHSMPNIYRENQRNPQYYWQVTKSINPYQRPPSSIVQQEINSNLIFVKNQVSDDSIIGSTANGELIKKINLGVPPSDTTVVSDKQKMLDTLNDAIKERNDFITKISDPRSTSQASRAKPCPLSKKAKIDPEPNIEPSKGYSPPILPIPSFQKAIELVKMKQKVHNQILSQVEKMVEAGRNLVDKKHGHRSIQNISKRKTPPTENKKHDKTKKISLEEYKKRVSKDGVDTNKNPKRKCKRKKVSKNIVVDNNQDLGYDSDATMKL